MTALLLTACAAAPATAPEPVASVQRSTVIPALTAALSGERREFDSAAGRISYYCSDQPAKQDAAERRPLLLIHSINASGSAYEVRPLYEHYRGQRPVYALDLPGFGFSERSDREYTPRLMTDAVHAMLDEIARSHGPGPVDALALSLSTEFLARAASERPARFHSLALVSPTGFSGARPRGYGAPGSTKAQPWLYRILSWRAWDDGLYGLLTRPGTIRYFLQRTWGSKNIDEGLWQYDVLSTRQPGAKHAPFYFLSASLFSKDVNQVYDSLTLPVWMSHGIRGDFVDYRGAATMQHRSNWSFSVFPTGALPYFETQLEFTSRYDAFLAAADAGSAEDAWPPAAAPRRISALRR